MDAAAACDDAVEARGLVEDVVDGLQGLVKSSEGDPTWLHAEVRSGKRNSMNEKAIMLIVCRVGLGGSECFNYDIHTL